MMQDFDVNINVPKDNVSEEITVTGAEDDVNAALVEIHDRIEKYNAEADDRVRNYNSAKMLIFVIDENCKEANIFLFLTS